MLFIQGANLPIGGIEIDSFITPPEIDYVHRARSVVYSLDGTAYEDRLGKAKKQLKLTFALRNEAQWADIKEVLLAENSKDYYITVKGSVGETDVSGNYRLVEDIIPTPIMVVTDDGYYVGTVPVTIEEV